MDVGHFHVIRGPLSQFGYCPCTADCRSAGVLTRKNREVTTDFTITSFLTLEAQNPRFVTLKCQFFALQLNCVYANSNGVPSIEPKTSGLAREARGFVYIYDLYWEIVDSPRIEKRKTEASSYRTLLEGFPKGGMILDIGVNVGEKPDVFLRIGAKVLAIEPEGGCQTTLRGNFPNAGSHQGRLLPSGMR